MGFPAVSGSREPKMQHRPTIYLIILNKCYAVVIGAVAQHYPELVLGNED